MLMYVYIVANILFDRDPRPDAVYTILYYVNNIRNKVHISFGRHTSTR